MTAADTGDVLFAGAALHAQEHLAVGTFEISVFPAVFHAPEELAAFGFPVGRQVDILPVFSHTLFMIPGEHPEECPDIESETGQGEKADAGEAAKKGADEAGNEGEHTEVIGTVTALHEPGKGHSETLEERHNQDSFRYSNE
jgi:hypothetical protein